MKKLVGLLIVFSLLISCNFKEEKVVKVNIDLEKEQINSLLDAWHESAAEANFNNYFNAMSAESVFVGTDAAEVWNVKHFKDFSKPYFDKGAAWSFKAIDRNIYLNSDGKIAWFDELLDTWMGVCRGSGVLKKTENGWKIEHYVLSVTVPNDNIQDVVAINKEKDSLFLAKFKK
jgi:hypothetical protein